MMKWMKFLGLWGISLFLTGCQGDIPYDAELFRANKENCWPCKMYLEAFNAMDKVLDGALDKIAKNSLIVLEMGLIFWLLFRVSKVVFSFSMPDMKKEFVSFITVLFKAAIVAIFLNNSAYIYDLFGNMIIRPLGTGFLSLADTTLSAPTELGIDLATYLPTGTLGDYLKGLIDILRGGGTSLGGTPSTSQMFGNLSATVSQIIFKIYAALWAGVGLGFNLWYLKSFSGFISGTILIAGMFWLIIRMPLTFVDAFIRIGLILLLSPLLMVGWVFSYPPGIVKKVFHNVLAGFFDILFACIYISFLISMFLLYSRSDLSNVFSLTAQAGEGSARTIADNFGTEFLILVMLTWTMVKLSGKIQDFSKYFFASAGKSGMLEMMGKFKNLAMKGVRLGATILSGPAGWLAGAAGAATSAVQDAAAQVNGTGTNASSGEGNASSEAHEQDNSRKASSQRKVPSKKEGGAK